VKYTQNLKDEIKYIEEKRTVVVEVGGRNGKT
jgi:hypothetical protein